MSAEYTPPSVADLREVWLARGVPLDRISWGAHFDRAIEQIRKEERRKTLEWAAENISTGFPLTFDDRGISIAKQWLRGEARK